MQDVQDHWDELILRATIHENGKPVLYQEGTMATLRTPLDLLQGYAPGHDILPEHMAMSCGTVGAIGGIRPSAVFSMALHDPRLGRTLTHQYAIENLPEIA